MMSAPLSSGDRGSAESVKPSTSNPTTATSASVGKSMALSPHQIDAVAEDAEAEGAEEAELSRAPARSAPLRTSSTHDRHMVTQALATDEAVMQLKSHKSSLPLPFYLLSFAPPISHAFSSPRAFCTHPVVLYVVGTMAALVAGVGMPALDILYGYWTNGIAGTPSTEQLARSSQVAWLMTVVAVVSFVFNWVFLTCFSAAAHDLTVRLRHTYVAAVLIQDQVFFDLVGPGEIATRAGKDVSAIRTGLGEKIAFVTWSFSTLLTGLISSFVHSGRLGGFEFALIPFAMGVFAILGLASEKLGGPALAVEGRAASLLEQILSSVRIVQAYEMAPRLINRLNEDMLSRLERLGLGRAVIRGIEQSLIYFVLNTSYAICFWYGGIRVTQGEDVGDILTSFWNIINALFAVANAVPHFAGIFDAYSSLRLLRTQIERQPRIDVRSDDGAQSATRDQSVPAFELRGVTFAYPSRPFHKSLEDLSVTIESGKITAFAGSSGSGKSTIASLLLREYDPETCNWRNPADPLPKEEQDRKKRNRSAISSKENLQMGEEDPEKLPAASGMERVVGSGTVLFRGQSVPSYNLRWLRAQIAIVSQSPQLFSASIFENVAAGLTGTAWAFRPDLDLLPDANEATKKRVQQIRHKCEVALKKAEAWTFVDKLSEGMDTVITGGRSSLLSGGQRQRVAIARALVREPSILILDEGTSALDSATEDRIKRMLEQEQKHRGMTLILIAHRLSTIASADKIYVLGHGKVLDCGRFDELVKSGRPDSTFKEMAQAQHAAVREADERQQSRRSGTTLTRTSTSTSRVAASTTAAAYTVNESDDIASGATPRERPPLSPLHRETSDIGRRLRGSFSARGGAGGPSDQLNGQTVSQKLTLEPRQTRSSLSDTASVHAASALIKRSDWSTIFRKFAKVIQSERLYFAVGILGAILGGGSFPLAGWMTGRAVSAISITGDDQALRGGTTFWARWFFILASGDLIVFLINALFLELGSESIVRKLKLESLNALLRQEIGFFDHEDSASGALTSAVSSHPSNVGAMTGMVLSQTVLSMCNLLGSVILGLVLNWKASVVLLAPIFVLFASGFAEVAALEKYESMAAKPAGKAATYINEAMDTVRTVSALGREAETMRTFDSEARSDPKRNRYLMLGALGFAVGQAMVLFLSALVFYWGGKLLSQGEITIAELYAVFEAIIIGAFSASRLFTFIGDYTRAFSSFATIESWLSREPRVATLDIKKSFEGHNTRSTHPAAGDIIFSKVEMRYPQRPQHAALKCVDLHIRAGTNVAFCGTSGSGKSSILALLQRFYDPTRGTISFDQVDSRSMNLQELRKGMAFVSQDPVLFEGTLRFNLLLGADDPATVTEDNLRSACEQACILDFCTSLPQGFDTDIGMKGAQLSGGQRQRICIARALLRDAPILLLDEATSALDPTSEKAVQRALDQISQGSSRTTITIAHRLSTIRNADVIYVVEDGEIVESGSHEELISLKGGRYVDLVAAQL